MDEQLLLLINHASNDFMDGFMYLLTEKVVWIPLYASLLYAIWHNYSWRGIMTLAVMIGIGMFFTDWFNAHILREAFARLRPNNPENPIFPSLHLVRDCRGGGYGFPSAHSANFWMLTFMMMHWLRSRMVTITMCVISILVCYSRIYMGYHYPGDILGGMVYAAIITGILAWLHHRYMHFSAAEEPRHVWVPTAVGALTILTFIVIAIAE